MSLLDATAVYGQQVTATATVSTDGSLRFFIDDVALSEPVTTSDRRAVSPPLVDPTTGDPLAPGTYTVRASLAPAASNTRSSSAAATLTIGKATTRTEPAVTGETLTATVTAVAPGSGVPSGTVEFTSSETVIGTAELVAGVATLDHALAVEAEHQIVARYAGDDRFTGSGGSVTRANPVLAARVTGATGKRGWHTGPVTITYTCSEATAPLAQDCPAPVTVRRSGAEHTVTTTITATDGGTATVVTDLKIDKAQPRVKLRGVNRGKTYAQRPTGRCVGTDKVSGIHRCTVTTKKVGQRTTAKAVIKRIRYTATAVDKAGNRSQQKVVIRVRTPR